MITAVDSSTLFDILVPDPTFGPESKERLLVAAQEGAVVICEVVYAEVVGLFSTQRELDEFLRDGGIQAKPSTLATLWKAGQLWKEFCVRQRRVSLGRRLLADFLIGAHAHLQADRLLTRDRDFYRTAFAGLRLV